ncbi:MAG: fatty oxidation complex subunit alpha [Bdellovibrionaceae bacterium]|nr:fatty oxidation complex subunit alpha [Pseudobdellovibrionaceae bacterium]
MPRIMGLQSSLDIILAGKSLDAKRAKKKGLVDVLANPNTLEDEALLFAQKMVEGKKPKRKKKYAPKGFMDSFLESPLGRPLVFKKAREAVMKNSKGFYPAPLKALDVIKKTYNYSNRERALLVEAQGFCEVAVTEISKHLINLFYLLEDVKKQSGVPGVNVDPYPVNSIGVLGAGVMGGGIAYVAADKGVFVRMKDITNDAIAKGFDHAKSLWKKKLKRRRLTKYEFENRMARVSGTLDYSGFKGLDVVIEAIVEDMKIKQSVIGETAKHCKDNCVIATNTSSLSVTEMAKGHPNPKNFVGMHFFNPVDKMPLVEIIRGEHTSDEAVATIYSLTKRMGKTPVVVKDGPGFLVNRLLLPLLAEAMFILEEGAVIEEVDRYYTHNFGMPMGPFRLMDEVGLDVCIKVLKIFQESLGERIEVSELSKKLAANSERLGRKNGKGFYLYDERGRDTQVDETVYAELGLPKPKGGISSKEAIERGILQMINEAARALKEDKICETAGECDLAMIMGTGFPPFRGGLLRYADSLGAEYVVQQLEEYAQRLGIRFKPSESLVAMANNKTTFY